MPQHDLAVFSIGTIPFILIFGALLAVGAVFILGQLTADVATEIMVTMGTIWLIVMLVLLIVTRACMSISPREMFVSSGRSFADAESDVCSMTADVINFIKNDVGKPGQDDPSLNDKAIADLVNKVNGPVTTCPPGDAPATAEETSDRLSRMQRTLDQFILPQLKKTYDVTFDTTGCDSFADYTFSDNEDKLRGVGRRRRHLIEPFANADVDADLDTRLKHIHDTVSRLTLQYLAPIKQKTADLQSGKVSDCDKKRGSVAAVP